MYLKMLKAAAAGLVLAVSSVANAGLIEADYTDAGDNLAVSDTVSSLTWLDLSVSNSWTFANWEFVYRPWHGLAFSHCSRSCRPV